MAPDIGAVEAHIKRYIADYPNPQFCAPGHQFTPLPFKDKLEENFPFDIFREALRQRFSSLSPRLRTPRGYLCQGTPPNSRLRALKRA